MFGQLPRQCDDAIGVSTQCGHHELDDFAALAQGSIDVDALGELQDKVEKAALAMAVNEAWAMLAAITLAAMLALAAARRAQA